MCVFVCVCGCVRPCVCVCTHTHTQIHTSVLFLNCFLYLLSSNAALPGLSSYSVTPAPVLSQPELPKKVK